MNNSSKSINTKHLFEVYLFPLFTSILISVLTYKLTEHFELNAMDKLLGYAIGVFLGFILYSRNKFKWIKHPEGHYFKMSGHFAPIESKKSHSKESNIYVAEYSLSISSKITNIALGLAAICLGIFMHNESSVITPLFVIVIGIAIFYSGFKELINSKPKLKLAKSGLWTKELGFQPWSSIKKTLIKTETGSHYSLTTYLEIYLKEHEFNFPDQRLNIDDLKNKDEIKKVIDELCN